jgi:hypothetical protein
VSGVEIPKGRLPSPSSVIIQCRRAHGPTTAAPGRSEFHHRPERMIAEFGAVWPWDAEDRRRWSLVREGAPGSARRSKRGTWVLTCPKCSRNLPIPECDLFRALDCKRVPGMDTGVDLLTLIRGRG